MFITIITPVKNSAETIERCITSVLNQSLKEEFEYIIIEGGSTDKTPEILERCLADAKGRVRLFKEPGKGPAFARNIGIKNARGEIIVFIDADCEADSFWLMKLIQPFENKNVDGVCGTVKTPKGLGAVARAIGLDWEYRQEERNIKKLKWFHLMNTAYRKEIFEKIGLLDEDLTTGEDQEFFRRAINRKFNFVFKKDAVVYHYYRSTLFKYLKQFLDYGKGSYKIVKKYKNLEIIILSLYFFSLIGSLSLIFLLQDIYPFLAIFFLGFGKYLYNSLQILIKSRERVSLIIGPLAYLGRLSSFIGFIYSFLQELKLKL
jgi:glycosyltransferase involved in cell wall biosynthesis